MRGTLTTNPESVRDMRHSVSEIAGSETNYHSVFFVPRSHIKASADMDQAGAAIALTDPRTQPLATKPTCVVCVEPLAAGLPRRRFLEGWAG